jgi:hypothetical protein
MSKKPEVSDEMKLLLCTARKLEQHLREHGRPKTMVEDSAELAGLLKPYNEADAAAEAAESAKEAADAAKEAKRHG